MSCDLDADVICGIDFIHAFSITIDGRHRKIQLPPVSGEEKLIISSVSSVTIPPYGASSVRTDCPVGQFIIMDEKVMQEVFVLNVIVESDGRQEIIVANRTPCGMEIP